MRVALGTHVGVSVGTGVAVSVGTSVRVTALVAVAVEVGMTGSVSSPQPTSSATASTINGARFMSDANPLHTPLLSTRAG